MQRQTLAGSNVRMVAADASEYWIKRNRNRSGHCGLLMQAQCVHHKVQLRGQLRDREASPRRKYSFS